MKADALDFAERIRPRFPADAFTRLELVALLATLCVLALTLLPLLASNSFRSNQVGCLNNLRQIGIAFQAWGSDHDELRPWFVSSTAPANTGGTRFHPLRSNPYIHYSCLSNYLSPQLLIDPAETGRSKRMASNWTASPAGGFLNPGFGNNALSYMFSLHTSLPEASDILSADRNVRFDGIGLCPVAGGTTVQILSRVNFRGWTNGPHGTAGNVLINDGRVEFASQDRFRALVQRPDQDFTPSDHILAPF